jgi:hypothetical protein
VVDSHSTPARVRPGIVTISSYLLILFAVIQVINLIITLTTIGKTRDVLRDAYAGTSANGAETVADLAFAAGIGSAILVLLLAIGLVVLAMLNNRGKNGARITTWVIGGILICCTGGSLITSAAGGFATNGGSTSGDVPSADEIQRRLDEALPSWIGPVTTLLGVIGLLSLLAALILLALPKSNEFFRKPQQAWEPPVPGGAYPGYPQTSGYPPAGQPGYPQPGQPGYPSAPGQPGQPPASEQWQPPSTPPAGPPAGQSEPGQPPATGGQDGPGEAKPPSDRPDPNPPSGS